MIVLDKIVISTTEPPSTRVLWVKPTTQGSALYVFNHGWEPMNIVDTKGTLYTQDDEIIDVKGGGFDGDIAQIVEQEVTKQMSEYDGKVHDTHNTEADDDSDYPEVDI